jgi:hypothetical protein
MHYLLAVMPCQSFGLACLTNCIACLNVWLLITVCVGLALTTLSRHPAQASKTPKATGGVLQLPQPGSREQKKAKKKAKRKKAEKQEKADKAAKAAKAEAEQAEKAAKAASAERERREEEDRKKKKKKQNKKTAWELEEERREKLFDQEGAESSFSEANDTSSSDGANDNSESDDSDTDAKDAKIGSDDSDDRDDSDDSDDSDDEKPAPDKSETVTLTHLCPPTAPRACTSTTDATAPRPVAAARKPTLRRILAPPQRAAAARASNKYLSGDLMRVTHGPETYTRPHASVRRHEPLLPRVEHAVTLFSIGDYQRQLVTRSKRFLARNPGVKIRDGAHLVSLVVADVLTRSSPSCSSPGRGTQKRATPKTRSSTS